MDVAIFRSLIKSYLLKKNLILKYMKQQLKYFHNLTLKNYCFSSLANSKSLSTISLTKS